MSSLTWSDETRRHLDRRRPQSHGKRACKLFTVAIMAEFVMCGLQVQFCSDARPPNGRDDLYKERLEKVLHIG